MWHSEATAEGLTRDGGTARFRALSVAQTLVRTASGTLRAEARLRCDHECEERMRRDGVQNILARRLAGKGWGKEQGLLWQTGLLKPSKVPVAEWSL